MKILELHPTGKSQSLIISFLIFFALLILTFGASRAHAGDIQMLPPVMQSDQRTVCGPSVTGQPQLLGWDGVNPMNCINNLSADPFGNLAVGTSSSRFTRGKLTITSDPTTLLFNPTRAVGLNPFDNVHVDDASLALVNSRDAAWTLWNAIGDSSFYINYSAGGGSPTVPMVTIAPNGHVGVGSYPPLAALDIKAPAENNNMTGILVESPSTPQGSPRVGLVDTSLGSSTAAPAWFIDNLKDTFRIFRQPNIYTPGTVFIDIDGSGNVGIGTSAPVGTLDVENTSKTAQICQNGSCVQNIVGLPETVIATGAWYNDSTGQHYVKATAVCPTNYVLLGGGAHCNSTNGGFMIDNVPASDPVTGNPGWYGACSSPPGVEGGMGVAVSAICAPHT